MVKKLPDGRYQLEPKEWEAIQKVHDYEKEYYAGNRDTDTRYIQGSKR